MRYHPLIFLLPVLLGLLSHPARVAIADEPAPETLPSRQPADFWPLAQALVQQQMNLIYRIETALISPNPVQVQGVRGRLAIHIITVEGLLKRYYSSPAAVCSAISSGNSANFSPVSYLSAEQTQVYCTLSATTQKLSTLVPLLERRQALLGSVTPATSPIPGVPATGLSSPLTNLPPTEPPLIGRTPKQPISDDVPPLPPAIAPLPAATTILQTVKQWLAEARRAFPPGTAFFAPNAAALIDERNVFDRYLQDQETYASFLALPNTGIAYIVPGEFYRQDPNQLRNRLILTPSDCLMPKVQAAETQNNATRSPVLLSPCPVLFSPLSQQSENGFRPQLEIQVTNGNFQIVPRELDYGFMTDLGDVRLETLNGRLRDVTIPTKEFFLKYQPPHTLEELQEDRRRFITGKVEDFCLCDRLFTQAPAVLNHTYLLRTVQFELPKVVVTGDRLLRWRRRYLAQTLKTPSSDLLIAFRPVSLNPDGSYTVLWRIIHQFPNPQIQDLPDYVDWQ